MIILIFWELPTLCPCLCSTQLPTVNPHADSFQLPCIQKNTNSNNTMLTLLRIRISKSFTTYCDTANIPNRCREHACLIGRYKLSPHRGQRSYECMLTLTGIITAVDTLRYKHTSSNLQLSCFNWYVFWQLCKAKITTPHFCTLTGATFGTYTGRMARLYNFCIFWAAFLYCLLTANQWRLYKYLN